MPSPSGVGFCLGIWGGGHKQSISKPQTGDNPDVHQQENTPTVPGPYNGAPLGNKSERITEPHSAAEEGPGHHTERKQPDTKSKYRPIPFIRQTRTGAAKLGRKQ